MGDSNPGTNTIRVKSIDYRSNASATVTRTVTVLRPLAVTASPEARGSVPAGFSPSSYREVGRSFTVTAVAKKGAIFKGWSLGGVDVASQNIAFTAQRIGVPSVALEKPTLTFLFREGLVLTADFEENPYDESVIGTYNGLIKASPDVPGSGTAPGVSTEGHFTATVTGTGAFSGKITIDELVLNVAGTFDHQGRARFGTARAFTQVVARVNKPSLIVRFDVGGPPGSVAPEGMITGEVTATNFKNTAVTAASTVRADRAHYTGTTGPATVPDAYLTVSGTAASPAGRTDGVFTVILPSVPLAWQPARIVGVLEESDYPKGAGVGTLRVTKAGAVTLTTTLADGTAMTSTGKLSQDLRVALFAPLYGLKGFFSAELQLDTSSADSDVRKAGSGEVLWSRPFSHTAQHYPYGWAETIELDLLGAKYVATAGRSMMRAPNGAFLQTPDEDGNVTLTFSEGLLSEEVVKSANLSNSDVVAKVPVNDPTFTMAVNRTTGAITGTFSHTDDTKPAYNAIIFQKGPNAGAHGYFLTKQPALIDYTGKSGKVEVIGQP
ncbi:hypothetical protein AYO49_00310 [Verrucomicrobiaceae bacterium SCGC AG-212-N21]|nr:hypothetical protein AYO49_00310 [Verrucomicrobiaceae bacterium SCGC AG-212-N21]